MQIATNFRQMPPSQPLREYGESKISKLEKYYNGIMEAKLTFTAEKASQKAEVTLNANGVMIRGESEGADAYAALDTVIDKLSRQLRRYHDKLKTHQPAVATKEMYRYEVRTPESFERARGDGKPAIVSSRTFPLKPMFPDDAVMEMELSDDDFMVFINADTSGVNVIYRRRDGNYGLVEPDR